MNRSSRDEGVLLRVKGLFRYALPLRHAMRVGAEMMTHRHGAVICVTDGALEGWGEAAPFAGFSRETIDDAVDALDRLAALGAAPAPTLLDNARQPSVRFALDTAITELDARRDGATNLMRSLELRSVLPIAALVSHAELAQANISRLHRISGQVVKVKVGREAPAVDAQHVLRLWQETRRTGCMLRLDANRSWSPREAAEFLAHLGDVRVDYLEEPLADPRELEDLARRVQVPIALDETLHELLTEDVRSGEELVGRALERVPSASVFILKPALMGAWDFTREVFAAAEEAGRRVVIGGAYESGIATRAVITLAAESPFAGAVGLDTYGRLRGDVLDPRLPITPPQIGVEACTSLQYDINSTYLTPCGREG